MRSDGFTLVEMLLSIGIIAMLVGLSVPVYNSFVARNDLDIATQGVVQGLRRAQAYARAVRSDSQWGLAVVSDKAVVFKGTTYASRDTNFDENILIPNPITTSGPAEVTFAKLTGAPSTTGSATLILASTNDTRTVTLNAKGMVE